MVFWGALGAAVINVIAIVSIVRASAVLRAAGINGEIQIAVAAKLWRATLRLLATVVIAASAAGLLPHASVDAAIVGLIWVVSVLDWLAKVTGERMARERVRGGRR